MNKRNLIFIAALAVSYLLMISFLNFKYPEQVNVLLYSTFGIVLMGIAIIGVLLSKGSNKKNGNFRVFKIILACFTLAFAIWMLGSVLLLPFIGHKGFELIGTPIFKYLLLGMSLLLSPFVAKKLA